MPVPDQEKSILDDDDFLAGMEDVLGLDGEAVETLISRMDFESLTALTDAIANVDKDAAETIVASFDTDEDVNPLFRGGDKEEEEKEPKKLKHVEKGHQFSFGDAVYVMRRDEQGKKKYIGATVDKPEGPHHTIGIKINGKSKMINYNGIFIEEGVLGMVGIPNLQRIQQLAGMMPTGQSMSDDSSFGGVQVEELPDDDPGMDTDCPSEQVMAALDTIEQALPSVRLSDLKAIKQRIVNIQTCMNEGVIGREKKI